MEEIWKKLQEKLQEMVLEGYSKNLKKEFLNPKNIGRMKNPDSWSRMTGECGDTVEIYLSVEKGRIKDIKFWTDGCGFTIACCSYVTRTVKGKSVVEAYSIKPEEVDTYFGGLPEENKHCAHLAVNSLKATIKNLKI
jgi:nitrogen fixation NifU-like protein